MYISININFKSKIMESPLTKESNLISFDILSKGKEMPSTY